MAGNFSDCLALNLNTSSNAAGEVVGRVDELDRKYQFEIASGFLLACAIIAYLPTRVVRPPPMSGNR